MRNYHEFKGYRTRTDFDHERGVFVYRKVPNDLTNNNLEMTRISKCDEFKPCQINDSNPAAPQAD